MKKSGRVSGKSLSTGRISSGRSSSGSISSGRSSSSSGRPASSSGGTYRSSGTGNTKISGFGILIVFIIILLIFMIIIIDSISYPVLFTMLALSLAGIGIFGVTGKPSLTAEDKLFESTITQFQIPNTKEALLEFALLATPKIKPVGAMAKMLTVEGKRQVWLNKVWTEKCNSIYARARIAMKDDSSSLNQIKTMMAEKGIKV